MSEQKKSSLPWVANIWGVKRPNFELAKISFSIPTTIPFGLVRTLVFFSIFYIYIGGVYDLVENPLAFGGSDTGGPALIWQSQDRQFLLEGIVAGLLMFLGFGGLYLIAQATSDPHDTERANRNQLAGTIFIIIAFYILQNMYQCKIRPDSC